jgi:hypothetical protein
MRLLVEEAEVDGEHEKDEGEEASPHPERNVQLG